jgi:hypothetical protein
VIPKSGRDGVSTGDVLLALATLCLVAALAYPRLERMRAVARAGAIAAGVDSLGTAAQRYRARTGTWPRHAPPGLLPEELSATEPVAPTMATAGYRLEWNVWERPARSVSARTLPDSIPPATSPQQDTVPPSAPPVDTLAGITVHDSDPRLLGLLLERYGDAHSFVRDSSWTLVLQAPGGR